MLEIWLQAHNHHMGMIWVILKKRRDNRGCRISYIFGNNHHHIKQIDRRTITQIDKRFGIWVQIVLTNAFY